MTIRRFETLALLAGVWLGATECAYSQTSVVMVSAHMDVWRAGGYNDGSDGTAPVELSFAAASRQVFTFRAGGRWACGPYPTFGPDGTTSGECSGAKTVNSPVGTFAGINFTDFVCPLVGMFLEDSLPVSAPPPLRFYVSDNSQGGIATDFSVLSPLIGQVFFIGDGVTGTKSGTVQVFIVPPTATHLYLGFVDVNGEVPGDYSNNVGGMEVKAILHTASQ